MFVILIAQPLREVGRLGPSTLGKPQRLDDAAAASTDRSNSVHNRCLIECFECFVASLCYFDLYCLSFRGFLYDCVRYLHVSPEFFFCSPTSLTGTCMHFNCMPEIHLVIAKPSVIRIGATGILSHSFFGLSRGTCALLPWLYQ